MTDTASLSRAFDVQGQVCAAFGSPFSAAMLARASADITAAGPTLGLLSPWAAATVPELVKDAVALRWLGCVHDLALGGDDAALAGAYPVAGRPGDEEAAWTAARAAMAAAPQHFSAFMAHEPQTNEVRRSIALLGGFLTVAAETGLPLRLFEIGASAGLNQLWDRFHYDLGPGGAWGDAASSVQIDTAWRGGPPPLAAEVSVVSRTACDRAPVDIGDAAARRRLRAYVWADQFDRLARLDGAVDMALATGAKVEAEDAVAWTGRRAAPADGAASVLFHSVFWQYMPAESQAAVAATIAALGTRATRAAPFAWLRMEPAPANMARMELRLTLWPDGEDRLLGHAHPHGAWVSWGADTE